MKNIGLKKSIIMTISIILSSFVGVVGITIGAMYFTGAFDPVVVTPTAIHFEKTLYEPDIYEYDENGNIVIGEDGKPKIVDYFEIKITAEPDNVTVKDVDLSVADTSIVRLESKTAQIGETIKVLIPKTANGLPYGGATTITAVANGGLYGVDTCQVFIDIPVTDISINASNTSEILHVNQVIDLYTPTFSPSKSRNPSAVSEGSPIVAKADKQYIYKLYFEFAQPGVGNTWIDVENPIYANNDSVKIAKWLDSEKTQIKALKTGRFKVVAYAFDTYKEQEKIVTQETESEKLNRMKVVKEQIYEVSEIDIASISSANYPTASEVDQISVIYKQTFKLYLRTNKTNAELAKENGINLGITINPDTSTGMSYKDMFNKIKDIYLTTNLEDDENDVLEIGADVLTDESGNQYLRPIMDNIWETMPDDQKEYYYTLTIKGNKSDLFKVTLNVVNPNDGKVISKDFSFKVGVIETEYITYTEGTSKADNVEISINQSDNSKSVLSATIDPENPKTINLNNYIKNVTKNGDSPTYDLIKFYAVCSTSEDDFYNDFADLSTKIDFESLPESQKVPYLLERNIYGVLIAGGEYDGQEYVSGILTMLGDVEVNIYAVLVQTDYEGKEVEFAQSGTYTYKYTYIKLDVQTILKDVTMRIVEENGELVEDVENNTLLENNEYKLYIRPVFNGENVDINVLTRVIDKISIEYLDEVTFKKAQIQTNGVLYLVSDVDTEYYCMDFSIPKSSLADYGKYVVFKVYYDGDNISSSGEYSIQDTSVKSVKLNVASEDSVKKKNFIYRANVTNSIVVWKEIYYVNGLETEGGEFDYAVVIDGQNKNYDLKSSKPEYISIVTVNGKQTLNFKKSTEGDTVTIYAVSVENSEIYDSITIELRALIGNYKTSDTLSSDGVSVRNGELYKNDVTYSKEVYYGQTENVLDMVNYYYNEKENNGLVRFSLLTATDNVKIANEDGENGLNRRGDVKFVRNVASSEIVTIVLTSEFDDVLYIRFALKNNLKINLDLSNAYNDSINSNNATSSIQNQAVVSRWNGKDYITFVYKTDSQVTFKDTYIKIFAISGSSTDNISNIFYRVDQMDYVTIGESTGIMTYTGYSGRPVTSPTVVTLRVYERAIGEDESTVEVFSTSFDVLLVPNILTKYIDEEVDGVARRVYLAGEYDVDTKANYTIELGSDDKVIKLLKESESGEGLMFAKDFAGNFVARPSVTFEVTQAVQIATYDSSNKSLTVVSKKVLTELTIQVKMTYTYVVAYVFDRVITVKPYYELTINASDKNNESEFIIHKNETKILYDCLTIANSDTLNLKDTISFGAPNQTKQYVALNERTSKSAYITGLTYSGNETASVEVFINSDATGITLSVKVLQDVGSGDYYKTNTGFDKEDVPYSVNCNSVIALNSVYTAKTYNGQSDLELSIKAYRIDNLVDGTNQYTEVSFAYLENGYIKFTQVADTMKLVIEATPVGLEGVDSLYAYFELSAGQTLTLSYPIEENKLVNLGLDKNAMINSFNGLNIATLTSEKFDTLGYLEIKAGETVDLSECIKAVNVVKSEETNGKDEETKINNKLSFKVLELDYDDNSWSESTKLALNVSKDATVISATAVSAINVPTLIWIAITSEGGLFDIYSVYVMDSSTVNNIDNIDINLQYLNSSNVIETDKTFECLSIDTSELNILSVQDGIRRVSATKGSKDYTSSLYMYVAQSINVECTIENNVLKFSNVQNGAKVVIGFYTSYHNSKAQFKDVTYNIYFTDGYIVNKLEEETSLTYDGTTNPIYKIKDYLTVVNVDGSEVDNLSYSYKASNGGVEVDVDKVITFFTTITGEPSFQLTNLANIDGTELIVRACVDGTAIDGAEYTFMLYPTPAVFYNGNAENSGVNSTDNPLILNKSVCSSITLNKGTGADSDLYGLNQAQFDGGEITSLSCEDANGDSSSLLEINDFTLNLSKDVATSVYLTIKVEITFGTYIKYENYYVLVLPNYICVTNKAISENIAQDSVYSLEDYNVFDTDNNMYIILKKYTKDGYQTISLSEATAFTIEVEGEIVTDGVFIPNVVSKITTKKIIIKNNGNEVCAYWIAIWPNINYISSDTSAESPVEFEDGVISFDLIKYLNIEFIDSNVSDTLKTDGVVDLNKVLSKGYTIEDSKIGEIKYNDNGKFVVDFSNVMTSEDMVSQVYVKLGDVTVCTVYYKVKKNYSFEVNTDLNKMYASQSLDLTYLGDSFVGSDGTTIVNGTLAFSLLDNTNKVEVISNSNTLKVKDGISISETTTVRILVTYIVDTDKVYTGITNVTVIPDYSIESKTSSSDYILLEEFEETTTEGDTSNLEESTRSAVLQNESDGTQTGIDLDITNKKLTINDKAYNFDIGKYIQTTKYGYPIDGVSGLDVTIKQVGKYTNIYSMTVTYGSGKAVLLLMLKGTNDNVCHYSPANETLRKTSAGRDLDLDTIKGEFYVEKTENGETKKVKLDGTITFVSVFGDNSNIATIEDGYLKINKDVFENTEINLLVRLTDELGEEYFGFTTVIVRKSIQFNFLASDNVNDIESAYVGDKLTLKDYISTVLNNPLFETENLIYDFSVSSVVDSQGKNNAQKPTINQDGVIDFSDSAVGDIVIVDCVIKIKSEGDDIDKLSLAFRVVGEKALFVHNKTLVTKKVNDTLALSDFGTIEGFDDASTISFKCLDNRVTLDENNNKKITSVNVLQTVESQIQLCIDNKYYAVGRILVEPSGVYSASKSSYDVTLDTSKKTGEYTLLSGDTIKQPNTGIDLSDVSYKIDCVLYNNLSSEIGTVSISKTDSENVGISKTDSENVKIEYLSLTSSGKLSIFNAVEGFRVHVSITYTLNNTMNLVVFDLVAVNQATETTTYSVSLWKDNTEINSAIKLMSGSQISILNNNSDASDDAYYLSLSNAGDKYTISILSNGYLDIVQDNNKWIISVDENLRGNTSIQTSFDIVLNITGLGVKCVKNISVEITPLNFTIPAGVEVISETNNGVELSVLEGSKVDLSGFLDEKFCNSAKETENSGYYKDGVFLYYKGAVDNNTKGYDYVKTYTLKNGKKFTLTVHVMLRNDFTIGNNIEEEYSSTVSVTPKFCLKIQETSFDLEIENIYSDSTNVTFKDGKLEVEQASLGMTYNLVAKLKYGNRIFTQAFSVTVAGTSGKTLDEVVSKAEFVAQGTSSVYNKNLIIYTPEGVEDSSSTNTGTFTFDEVGYIYKVDGVYYVVKPKSEFSYNVGIAPKTAHLFVLETKFTFRGDTVSSNQYSKITGSAILVSPPGGTICSVKCTNTNGGVVWVKCSAKSEEQDYHFVTFVKVEFPSLFPTFEALSGCINEIDDRKFVLDFTAFSKFNITVEVDNGTISNNNSVYTIERKENIEFSEKYKLKLSAQTISVTLTLDGQSKKYDFDIPEKELLTLNWSQKLETISKTITYEFENGSREISLEDVLGIELKTVTVYENSVKKSNCTYSIGEDKKHYVTIADKATEAYIYVEYEYEYFVEGDISIPKSDCCVIHFVLNTDTIKTIVEQNNVLESNNTINLFNGDSTQVAVSDVFDEIKSQLGENVLLSDYNIFVTNATKVRSDAEGNTIESISFEKKAYTYTIVINFVSRVDDANTITITNNLLYVTISGDSTQKTNKDKFITVTVDDSKDISNLNTLMTLNETNSFIDNNIVMINAKAMSILNKYLNPTLDSDTSITFYKQSDMSYRFECYDSSKDEYYTIYLDFVLNYTNVQTTITFGAGITEINLVDELTEWIGSYYDNDKIEYTFSNGEKITFDKYKSTSPLSIYGKNLNTTFKATLFGKAILDATINIVVKPTAYTNTNFTVESTTKNVGVFTITTSTYTDGWGETYTTNSVNGQYNAVTESWIKYVVSNKVLQSDTKYNISALIKAYKLTYENNIFTSSELEYNIESIKLNDKTSGYENALEYSNGSLEIKSLLNVTQLDVAITYNGQKTTITFAILPIAKPEFVINETLKNKTDGNDINLIATNSFNIDASKIFSAVRSGMTLKVNGSEVSMTSSTELEIGSETRKQDDPSSSASTMKLLIKPNEDIITYNVEEVGKLIYVVKYELIDGAGNTLEYATNLETNGVKARDFIFTPSSEVIEIESGASRFVESNQIGSYILAKDEVAGYDEFDILAQEDKTTYSLLYEGAEAEIKSNATKTIYVNEVLVDTYIQVTVKVEYNYTIYLGYIIVLIKASYDISVTESMRYVEPNSTIDARDLIKVTQSDTDITSSLKFGTEFDKTDGIDGVTISCENIETSGDDGNVTIIGGDIRFLNGSAGNKYRIVFNYFYKGAKNVYTNSCVVSVSDIVYNFERKEEVLILHSGQSINLTPFLVTFLDRDGKLIDATNYSFEIVGETNVAKIEGDKLTVKELFNDSIQTLKITLSNNSKNYVGYMDVNCLATYEVEDVVIGGKPANDNYTAEAIEENGVVDISYSIYNSWLNKINETSDLFTTIVKVNGEQASEKDIVSSGSYTFKANKSYAGTTVTIEFIITATSGDTTSFVVNVPVKARKVLLIDETPNVLNYSLNTGKGMNINEIIKLASGADIAPTDFDVVCDIAKGEFTYDKDTGVLKIASISSNMECKLTITDKLNGSSVTYTCVVMKMQSSN